MSKNDEFCKDINCHLFIEKCLVKDIDSEMFDHGCPHSAKQFHLWLESKGFKIIKSELEVKPVDINQIKIGTHHFCHGCMKTVPNIHTCNKPKPITLYHNCYICYHQSAIIGCDYRHEDKCDGTIKYTPRRTGK